jgi:hypothetical protein
VDAGAASTGGGALMLWAKRSLPGITPGRLAYLQPAARYGTAAVGRLA